VSSHPDQASPGPSGSNGSLPPQGKMRGPVPPGPVPPGPVPPSGPVPPGQAPGPAGQFPGASRLKSAWKTDPDGRTVFRLIPPLVLWWIWVAFVVINLGDLAIQGRDRFGLEVACALIFATGIMYVCTVRPRIVTDDDGITVINPFRDHTVPWGLVTGVFVGDSVEIGAQRPAPKKEKTIYSWALYSPRRARARAELRSGLRAGPNRQRYEARRTRRRFEVDPEAFGRAPAQAKELASQHPSHIMARELARRCEAARTQDAPGGALKGRWDWIGIAAVVLPAILLAVVIAV
jgi:hypothetical protein